MLAFILLLTNLLIAAPAGSIHEFKIQALDSDDVIDLASYKGKKILIVNVASKCGYTPQYSDLQKLSVQHEDDLVIIGFPCDQFKDQELNTEAEIRSFCTNEFQVTFPMTTMVEVKGENQHPIYQWLTKKTNNGKGDYEVGWNFNKFLLDEDGNLLEYYPSKVKPMDEAILKYLK